MISRSEIDLNVCIITSWFPNRNEPNRATFVYNLAKNLAKSDVTVSIISPSVKGEESEVIQDSMKIYRVSRKFSLFSILRLVNQIKPDVIHVQAPNFFSSTAIMVAKLKKIPIIATVHRAEVDKIGILTYLLRKHVLRRFRKIIAVSDFTKSLALKAGADLNKIIIINNSCDETLFSRKDKFEARKKQNLPTDKRIILFVGNLIQRKGVNTLIGSLKILSQTFPDFLLLVIGSGEERTKLELLANTYGLINNIKFLGKVSEDALPEFHNAADVFVLPSISEGHSVALLEAMASGLPIIASRIGGNKESVEDGVNGFLFEVSNVEALAEKLATVLTDNALREQMSINSSKIYSEKFSAKIQIENHLKLYRSLIVSTQSTENNSGILLIDNQGLSHYTSYLASGLSKYHEVNLLGFSEEEYSLTCAGNNKIKFYPIAEKLPKGTSLISSAARMAFLFAPVFLALTKLKYDVVHIQGHLPMFFLFIPMLKLRRKQLVWTLHDVNLRPSSRGMRGKLELSYTMAVTQPGILSRCADAIIVHGSLLKKNLTAKGVNGDKVHVIPHFDYRYLLNSDDKPANHNTTDYILVFGRIKPYKGIDVLISALKIVRKRIGKNFNVLITGKGDASYFKNLLTAEDMEYIHIRNEFVPTTRIHEVFANARFVVLPYTSGSQSGVVPLAYTFSKPVIVSNVGSIGECVEHGKTGFIFESGDVTQLANYITELVEDNRKCIEMGENAYQKLLQEMSLEKCCAIINDIYKRH